MTPRRPGEAGCPGRRRSEAERPSPGPRGRCADRPTCPAHPVSLLLPGFLSLIDRKNGYGKEEQCSPRNGSNSGFSGAAALTHGAHATARGPEPQVLTKVVPHVPDFEADLPPHVSVPEKQGQEKQRVTRCASEKQARVRADPSPPPLRRGGARASPAFAPTRGAGGGGGTQQVPQTLPAPWTVRRPPRCGDVAEAAEANERLCFPPSLTARERELGSSACAGSVSRACQCEALPTPDAACTLLTLSSFHDKIRPWSLRLAQGSPLPNTSCSPFPQEQGFDTQGCQPTPLPRLLLFIRENMLIFLPVGQQGRCAFRE